MGGRGHNRHEPKRGGLLTVVPLSRRAGSPSDTMWPGRRSTSVPSGVSHPESSKASILRLQRHSYCQPTSEALQHQWNLALARFASVPPVLRVLGDTSAPSVPPGHNDDKQGWTS